jgi:energy-coupling factor transporter ATP-binding protein EcfA2
MDDVLLGIVVRRLDAVPLAGPAADLLLAALESDESLAAQLGGEPRPESGAPVDMTSPQAAGAYLQSLTVSGFRGIGAPATLEVAPRPGLTLVVGRNGSGKSSFAEALEVLLTGNLRRWDKLSVVWRQGWRSVHQPDAARISAEFLVEGAGVAVIQRTWPRGADFTRSSAWVQVAGEKQAGIERLGWTTALADYRPFLSHSELEAFFGSPSGLYELLASVLGLEDLTLAAARLAQARKVREAALGEVKKRLPDLLARLEAADDERAAACHRALAGRSWDLAAARSVAGGRQLEPIGGELDRLRRLAVLTSPAADAVRDAANELRRAAADLDATAGTAAGRARALADLLTAALRHHDAHGDGDCPVCGRSGALTSQWRRATEEEVARLTSEAQAADDAERTAAKARRLATSLIQPPAEVLLAEAPLPGVDTTAARAAWQRWASPPEAASAGGAAGLRVLAGHLDQALEPFTEQLGQLVARASAEVSRRDDSWIPFAAEVSSWCADAAAAQEGLAPVAEIKAAERWLKGATDDIRNERLAPLADEARAIWAMLRQESNVDLGTIRLAGSATQRHVELNVSVDGAPGSALGVMSQGEVNALALSVFLPRATLPASTFRFLVIDDPVQAMDPAKVDGLARVLQRTAADRQIIVFTHDNRLAQAVRQLSIPATILEVTRRPGSAVEVRPSLEPAEQALTDAGALAADPSVPAAVAARVIPGLCRTAVEAAFTEAVWRRELRAGRRHTDIEADLEAARVRLNPLAALALTGDASKGGDVLPRLNAWGYRFADTYQALNKGAHSAHDGDLRSLIGDTRKLVDKIRAMRP